MCEKIAASDGASGQESAVPDMHVSPLQVVSSSPEQKPDCDELEALRGRVFSEFNSLEPRLRSMIEKRVAPRLRGRVDIDLILRKALSGLLKAIESKQPGTESELRAWIFRKVWSRWYDELRRWNSASRDAGRQEDVPLGSDVALVRGIGVATDLCLKEVVDRIRTILGPVDFVIVELRIVDEMSFTELAGLVGLSEAAVGKRFSRALLKIKEVIRSPFNSSW